MDTLEPFVSVLIIQFSLCAKALFMTIVKCVDYVAVLISKCPDYLYHVLLTVALEVVLESCSHQFS